MAGDWEPAALVGALLGKRREHEESTGANSTSGGLRVLGLIEWLSEEVECRPVVPDRDWALEGHRPHVRPHRPHHACGSDSESVLELVSELVERTLGHVGRLNRPIPVGDELSDERRGTTSDDGDMI